MGLPTLPLYTRIFCVTSPLKFDFLRGIFTFNVLDSKTIKLI